jgi:hypothetical protein
MNRNNNNICGTVKHPRYAWDPLLPLPPGIRPVTINACLVDIAVSTSFFVARSGADTS